MAEFVEESSHRRNEAMEDLNGRECPKASSYSEWSEAGEEDCMMQPTHQANLGFDSPTLRRLYRGMKLARGSSRRDCGH